MPSTHSNELTRLRKANLRTLVISAGGPSLFLDLYGRDENQVMTWTCSQLSRWVFDPASTDIGDADARAIESRLGLSDGWLDARHPLNIWR